MADLELRINVKATKDQATENNLKEIKQTFGTLVGPEQAQNFEKIARSFRLTEVQIKELMVVVTNVQPTVNALSGLLGKGGLVLAGFTAAIAAMKFGADYAKNIVQGVIDIANAARRMGGVMHPAQLQANINLMETVGIDPGRGLSMMETLVEKNNEFRRINSEFRQSIMDHYAKKGPGWIDPMRRWMNELTAMPDLTQMANRIRTIGDEIEQEYIRRGGPTARSRAAQEKRQWLEFWFGLPDFELMHQDFVKVSETSKVAWEKNEKAFRDFYKVTTEIDQKVTGIMRSFVSMTMDRLGITPILEFLNKNIYSPMLDRLMGVAEARRQYEKYPVWDPRHWFGAGQSERYRREWGAIDPTGGQGSLLGAIGKWLFGSGSTKTPSLQGVPGGPGGSVNNDLSEGFYSRMMGGSQGYNDFVNAAHAQGISPSIALTGGSYNRTERISPHERNLNPGNIKAGPYTTGHIGFDEQGHAIFPTMTAGAAAQGEVLRHVYGGKTLDAISRRYTAVVKDQKMWRDVVGQEAGLKSSDKVDFSDPDKLAAFQRGVWRAEGGKGWQRKVEERLASERTSSQQMASNEPLRLDQPQLKPGVDPGLAQIFIPGQLTAMKVGQGIRLNENWMERVPRSENVNFANPRQRFMGPQSRIGQSLADYNREVDFYKARRENELNPALAKEAGIEDIGRSRLDRDMARDIDIKGKLNVNVEAPAGTEVRAKGGGMFEDSVNLDRQMADQ